MNPVPPSLILIGDYKSRLAIRKISQMRGLQSSFD